MLNFANIVSTLNDTERKNKYSYITDGYESAINYGEINVFSTENEDSTFYDTPTVEGFINNILIRTKEILIEYMKDFSKEQ